MKKNKKKSFNKKHKKRTHKKKYSLKIKNCLIFMFLILFVACISLLIYKHNYIKNHFHNNVITTTNKVLYIKENNKYKKIGVIYKNNILSLEKMDRKFYKIKGKKYYVTYTNLKKSKVDKSDSYNSILFNEELITKKNVIIYRDNKKYFKLNKNIKLDILEKYEDYYICLYEDKLVKVKKKDVKEIKEKDNHSIYINKMPVLFFEKNTNLEEMINYIKEANYNSISIEDYKKWKNKNIILKEKSILLIVQEDNKELNQLFDKYKLNYNNLSDSNIEFFFNDSFANLDNDYWYEINNFIEFDRFKDMLNEVKLENYMYASNIAVLNYHFFNDPEKEECNEIICLKTSVFEEQLKYLSENNYKTLTMAEYNKWLKGEIVLPKKSVLLTVDDGALGTDTHLPDLLDKYNKKATLFLITSFWPMSKYRVGSVEIQSHGDALHENNYCRNGICDFKTKVLTYDEILKDLQKSKEIIGNNVIAYCYPFYEYDSKTIEAVKKEFQLAFVGGNRKSNQNNDPYLIPRYVILNDITIDEFIGMIS